MISSETLPWKNGFWFNKASPVIILNVENEEMTCKNLIFFDNPEVKDLMKGRWKSGDFGKASDDFIEKTGVQNYNFKATYNEMFNLHGAYLFSHQSRT